MFLLRTATNPLLTAPILYLLTLAPPHLRAQILQSTPLNTTAKLTALVIVLQLATGVGVLRHINASLNALAWNKWGFGRKGAVFAFGEEKEEVVLITGGSSGFGYEMVRAFQAVARVVVVDVRVLPEELAELPDVHFYQCDLADLTAVEAVCARIHEEHGDVAVLVNNAGITYGKTVLETSNAECQKLFQVNLVAQFALVRAFLPGMLERRKGHIVTIASMASFVPSPGLVDYACSKVAELHLTEGIRAECATHYTGGEGICTSTIHPSWHATSMLKGREKIVEASGIRLDPPSRVSEVVLEQVLSGRSGRVCVPASEEYITGVMYWPRWVQDVLFGFLWKPRGSFEFGRGMTFNIPE